MKCLILFSFFTNLTLQKSISNTIPHSDALVFLKRNRRANKRFEELLRSGNKERECFEEKCDLHEIQEIKEIKNEGISPKLFREQLADKCKWDPCYKAGTIECINQWADRTCICKTGYGGNDCSENIDECENNKKEHEENPGRVQLLCKNNADCVDQTANDNPRGYRCRCWYGWTGENCETDINECHQGLNANSSQTACDENSVCINTLGSFTCMNKFN